MIKNRMRLIGAGTALVLCIVSLSGCVGVNYSIGSREKVYGEGERISYEVPVEEYTSVEIDATNIDLIYSNEPSDVFKMEIQENLREYVHVYSDNGTLVIETEKQFASGFPSPKFYIYAPDLKLLDISGGVTIKDSDTISGESFKLVVAGACSGTLSTDVDDLGVWVSGAGDMNLKGRADKAEFQVSGAGDLRGLDLETKDARVSLSGAGSMSISCSDSLDVRISGAADITYRGDPVVNKSVSGAGTVRKVD